MYWVQSQRLNGSCADRLYKQSSGPDNHPDNTATGPDMYLCKREPKYKPSTNDELHNLRYHGVPSTRDVHGSEIFRTVRVRFEIPAFEPVRTC